MQKYNKLAVVLFWIFATLFLLSLLAYAGKLSLQSIFVLIFTISLIIIVAMPAVSFFRKNKVGVVKGQLGVLFIIFGGLTIMFSPMTAVTSLFFVAIGIFLVAIDHTKKL